MRRRTTSSSSCRSTARSRRLNAQAKAAGFDNWVQHFKFKSDWRLNPEVPTLSAWKMVQPINGQTWLLERNPYY